MLQDTKLGPGVVQTATATGMTVLLDGIEVAATSAMALPYVPQPGDVVLVIGQHEHYVIGLIKAQGDCTLRFPANVHVHARGGIQLTSGERVEMQAPEVKVAAGKWEVVARTLSEKVHSAMRWVRDLSTLKAGRRRVQVQGVNIERAERHLFTAQKDVRVNGHRIHIG
jgi:hypothetical protein